MKLSNNKLVEKIRELKEIVFLLSINLSVLLIFVYFYPAIFNKIKAENIRNIETVA